MARRSMKAKIQPAVMKLNFVISPNSTNIEFNHIDLSQVASIVNRRFYRQGLNWAVAKFKVITSPGVSGNVAINKLPNTWVMGNAWEKTFRAWQRQQKEVLEDGTQESVKAKFNDFKIFANKAHYDNGASNNLLPISARDTAGGPYTATAGEWQYSQIVVPNYTGPGVNFEPYLMAVGNTAGSVCSLVELYEKSRSTPQSPDPNVPGGVLSADNLLLAMFDVGDNNDDVLANVVGKNDELPYPQDNYPGGDTQMPSLEIHDIENITTTTIGGTTELSGGNFPCGLIEIGTQMSSTADVLLEITLVPGYHRGYLAESMTEM